METAELVMLRPSRTKWILVGVGSLAFVLACVNLDDMASWIRWLGGLFFGFGVLVSGMCLVPHAAYLSISIEGFTVCSLFRAHKIAWSEVREFGVAKVLGVQKLVGFNFEGSAGSLPRSPVLRSLNRRVSGFEAGLPDNYGIAHEELAALLNRHRSASHVA